MRASPRSPGFAYAALLAVSLVGCVTQVHVERERVAVSADSIRGAMSAIDAGASSATLTDQVGLSHRADADTFVSLADRGPAPQPSMTLSALGTTCAGHDSAADPRCPLANPRATYILAVEQSYKTVAWTGKSWGTLLVASAVVGAAALDVWEIGCFVQWCNGGERRAVVAADVTLLLVAGVAALALWTASSIVGRTY
jgi:hypothetical protein